MELPDFDKKVRVGTGAWRTKILGAIVITALGGAFCTLTFTQGLSRFSYDFPMFLRPEIHPTNAVIVYMDDESRKASGQPEEGLWDRALHVQLLARLTALHAREVVFDVLMDEPWTNKAVDEEMAKTIKTNGRVVLGARIQEVPGLPGANAMKVLHPVDPIGSVAPWGEAGLWSRAEFPGDMEMDGVVRRQYYGEDYTNLAWQAAAILGAAPADRARERWINYYGPGGTIPHLSYSQVLRPSGVFPEVISGKVVFVGKAPWITSQGDQNHDELFSTPLSRWEGHLSPGVEVHATAFLNLVRGDWISRVPLPVELGLILFGGVVLAFALPGKRPSVALLLCAGFSVVACIGGILLEQRAHWWFSWAVMAFVEAPASLAWYGAGILSRRDIPAVSVVARPVPFPQPDQPATEAAATEKPEIPDHELLRLIGVGGYGKVWLARNNALNTFRAVKIVSRSALQNAGPFESEFRGIQTFEPISRLHQGFVDILQVGRRDDAGYFYYVMELADDQETGQNIVPAKYAAKTLASERVRRKKLPCAECIQIGMELCVALHNLHERGLVHRDLKPSNIIFINGAPKLADIGLVIAASDAKTLVGTMGFIPSDGAGKVAGDIYSLGKVLFEISTGKNADEFPSLPDTLGGADEAEHFRILNAIILKACEPAAERRYRTAAEFQSALKRAITRLNRKQE
jgi:CHASE2 domain-containing sensor protein